MTPYVDDKPHKLFVTRGSIDATYKELKRTIKKNGSIPLGIDHIKEADLNKYPILKELDLLNVGKIHDVYAKDNEIYIKEATLTNPMIRQMYDEGKLKALSSVGSICSKPCSTGKADSIAVQTKIERVDFVPKGACETCTIDNNKKSDNGIFNARLSAQKGEIMAGNENKVEIDTEKIEEQILESVEETISDTIDEKMDEKLDTLKEELLDELKKDNSDGDKKNVDAKLAKQIEEQNKRIEAMEAAKSDELAEALVESAIQAGKALPKQKGSLVEFAKSSPEAYKEHMNTIEPFVPLGKRGLEAGASNPEDKETELYLPSDHAKAKKRP